MSEVWHAIVSFVHVLGGGVWIGAVGFNVFVLHPRAEKFFTDPGRFEDFVLTVVSGMRWWVVAGIAMLGGAGFELVRVRGLAVDSVLLAKIGLLALVVVLFVLLSWRMWPARVLASAHELPALRRRFSRVGATMVAFNLLNAALGVWHHAMR